MKLKKILISVLSLVSLASCNRGTATTDSVTSAPGSDATSTSSSATKSNQLTKEMFAELAEGYSIEETVSGYDFQTLDGEDYATTYMSFVQYVDSNDNVLHLKAGKNNDDTKKDPVKPESFETTDYDLYYVSDDQTDGKIYANAATLSLNNEPNYVNLYNSENDPTTGQTNYTTRVEWYTLFSPAFSQFSYSDFTKITDSVRTFRFTAPEEKDEDLAHALEVFSYQIFGMSTSLDVDTITLHTDGYHITDFEATAYYTFSQTVDIDEKGNKAEWVQELELTAKGNFTSIGGSKIENFAPATGTPDSTFDSAMSALRQNNFKFREAHYVSSKADGNFSNKVTDQYSGVMNGKSFIYYDSASLAADQQPTNREGLFQVDDNHYNIAVELAEGTQDNPTTSWYKTSGAMEGKITDVLPSFEISPLLFDDEDGIKIFRLKKEYMKIVNFTSGAFDILKPNNGSTITSTSTSGNASYDLTDFSIDLSSYDAEGIVVFTYVYDSEKYIITYTDINKVAQEALPTLKWANIADNVTLTDDGKTSLYEMWNLTDGSDLTTKLLEKCPIIPGNAGLAVAPEFKMTGYVIQINDGSAITSANSALSQFISLFEGMGYTGDRKNQATEDDANTTGKLADYIYKMDYTHTDGTTYALTAHVMIYMVQTSAEEVVLLVGYSFSYEAK